MLGFTAMPAVAQNDTSAATAGQSEYSCAFTTPTTLACVKGDVDQNQDGMLDSDEWAQVPEEDRAIIDLENRFEEGAQPNTEDPLYREDRQQQQSDDMKTGEEGTFGDDRNAPDTQNDRTRGQQGDLPMDDEGTQGRRSPNFPENHDMETEGNY